MSELIRDNVEEWDPGAPRVESGHIKKTKKKHKLP